MKGQSVAAGTSGESPHGENVPVTPINTKEPSPPKGNKEQHDRLPGRRQSGKRSCVRSSLSDALGRRLTSHYRGLKI